MFPYFIEPNVNSYASKTNLNIKILEIDRVLMYIIFLIRNKNQPIEQSFSVGNKFKTDSYRNPSDILFNKFQKISCPCRIIDKIRSRRSFSRCFLRTIKPLFC